ncbi:MAG: S-methyl-5-thioribose-1-phosphate isomerase, partial [Verrucomicrobiota bacterium]
MKVDGTPFRTVWLEEEAGAVGIIDQRKLPFSFETVVLRSTEEAAVAIQEMYVRGAGCIGAVAAHGMYLAAEECFQEAATDESRFEELFQEKGERLCATRPTAV